MCKSCCQLKALYLITAEIASFIKTTFLLGVSEGNTKMTCVHLCLRRKVYGNNIQLENWMWNIKLLRSQASHGQGAESSGKPVRYARAAVLPDLSSGFRSLISLQNKELIKWKFSENRLSMSQEKGIKWEDRYLDLVKNRYKIIKN